MKKNIILSIVILLSTLSYAQPSESLGNRVRRAFSLVGRWEIVKMEIDRGETVRNPGTVREASLAEVNITVKSDLGSYGYFDVDQAGNIDGKGEVIYEYRVGGGSSAFSMGAVPLAIGAVAMLHNDNGVRKFTVTGSANLSGRTIKLDAFKPVGAPLQMIIRPGNSPFTSVLWPPMTNIVATQVIVAGSSLLFRASGVLQGIKVTFEAVKFVDLAGLFTDLETYIDNRVTNIINNNVAGSSPNPTSGNNNTGNPASNENGSGGGSSVVAGYVNVPTGGTANVLFRLPRANTNYAISFGPMNGVNNAPVVTFSDKTNTGFKIHVKGTGTVSVRVDWVVAGYNN